MELPPFASIFTEILYLKYREGVLQEMNYPLLGKKYLTIMYKLNLFLVRLRY